MDDQPFSDEFDGADLDDEVWNPHFLPMWCARDHDPPLRVSGIQSGVVEAPALTQSLARAATAPAA